MAEVNNYQMAIDLLCCHLGISEEEAKQQLGITPDSPLQQSIFETQSALVGMTDD